MATTLRCQVTLTNVNSIPADASINVWHFKSNSVDRIDDAVALQLALGDFYSDIGGIFGASMNGDIDTKVYDLADSSPRVPISTGTGTFSPGIGTSLPAEVAICLSYAALLESGGIPGRRRGRIFLGPLDAGVVAETGGRAYFDASFAASVTTAAETLMNAGGTDWGWSVFSPTGAGAEPWSPTELSDNTFVVMSGFVDNAFDTMRSRGVAPTNRVTWP